MMSVENYKNKLESMSKEELLHEISNLISDHGVQIQNKNIELQELKSALASANLQLQFQIGEVDLNNREIERLTEEKDKYQEKWQTSYMNELNLQKQVDELKKWLGMKEHYIGLIENRLKQSIKDTAKDIWERAIKDFVGFDEISLKRLKQIITDKGVEVE